MVSAASAIHQRGGPGLLAQRRHLIGGAAQLGQALHRRMVDREHEERDAPQRVGARGVDLDLLAGLGDREGHARAFAASDPVALHRDDALGPIDQVVHVVQQPLGVVGDLVEPLRQVAALHHRAAALARALDHLLVRQHRLVVRAPVDRRVLPVGQALGEEPREQPLGPAVVGGVARVEPPGPIERHPHALERGRLLLDVGVGPLLRGNTALDGRVLRGQAERVPTDRMQHVVAAHRLVAGHRVAAAERLGMAHVQVARGVREHVERVEPGPGIVRILGRAVQTLVGPHLLPLRLDLGCVVAPAHGGHGSERPTPGRDGQGR